MPKQLKAIRGMHDILPKESYYWQHVEMKIKEVLDSYGYHELRLPILESTELFTRSIGQQTDIVAKEMYSFVDRNGDSLTLRPEGTAGCVRAGIEHGLFHNQTQKLWYMGPMFRHERPQRGRLRQFHQIGVEAFGFEGPDIDVEMILLGARLWSNFGLQKVKLQLNSLGNLSARAVYKKALINYFSKHQKQLDTDSLRRLNTNPLRILDSKNQDMQELINSAPVMQDYLDQESAQHFDQLQSMLNTMGIEYEINPYLVRGLDYYSKTVYEWCTDQLGAQNAICAGGRYNVEYFSGGEPIAAFGFALGIERLITLLKMNEQHHVQLEPLHAYLIVSPTTEIVTAGMQLAESLRTQLPWLRLKTHCGDENFKKQFKHADKSGALFALILGSEEIENQHVGLKSLRSMTEQKSIPWDKIGDVLKNSVQSALHCNVDS
ncbi:Histidyl-tRNA synthetase [uncultured Candidatus Thioglobus sp.]|nr:Histidyl-tRNA synthetase [uncultured Candidatus Thioglobus sp.]